MQQENPGVDKRTVARRLAEEWRKLEEGDRLGYENEGGRDDGVLAIGVTEFMDRVKRERKKEDVDPEFKEDQVLMLVNHKEKRGAAGGRKKRDDRGTFSQFRLNYFFFRFCTTICSARIAFS